jgi:hypothetical protein
VLRVRAGRRWAALHGPTRGRAQWQGPRRVTWRNGTTCAKAARSAADRQVLESLVAVKHFRGPLTPDRRPLTPDRRPLTPDRNALCEARGAFATRHPIAPHLTSGATPYWSQRTGESHRSLLLGHLGREPAAAGSIFPFVHSSIQGRRMMTSCRSAAKLHSCLPSSTSPLPNPAPRASHPTRHCKSCCHPIFTGSVSGPASLRALLVLQHHQRSLPRPTGRW